MLTVTTPVHPRPGASTAGARLASLDAFRGLVIVVMTFVNYLAGVRNIPAWAQHAPADADAYTFVDVVFPGFLFIVGVAIPISLHNRMARGEPALLLLRRIVFRSAALIFAGVLMVNSSLFSAEASGVSKHLWFFLAMFAVVVLWSAFITEGTPGRARAHLVAKIAAGITLVVLLILFRGKNPQGEVVWLQHSWWGILGMIGWAYLICSLAYLVCRGQNTALMGVLGFMIVLYIGDRHGALAWLGRIHDFIGVGKVFGSTAANVMMGALVGNCFVGANAANRPLAKARFFLLFGAGLYVAGTLLRPLHGINKIAATESYALVTGGICCLCFLVVYLLIDVLQLKRWAAPLIPVGENALLAYVLPGIVGNFLGVLGLQKFLWLHNSGWPGALNAAALTLLILAITWAATRAGVRLKL